MHETRVSSHAHLSDPLVVWVYPHPHDNRPAERVSDVMIMQCRMVNMRIGLVPVDDDGLRWCGGYKEAIK